METSNAPSKNPFRVALKKFARVRSAGSLGSGTTSHANANVNANPNANSQASAGKSLRYFFASSTLTREGGRPGEVKKVLHPYGQSNKHKAGSKEIQNPPAKPIIQQSTFQTFTSQAGSTTSLPPPPPPPPTALATTASSTTSTTNSVNTSSLVSLEAAGMTKDSNAPESMHLSEPSPHILKEKQIHAILEADVVDLDKLRNLAWGGVPLKYRAMAWQLLLGYLPCKKDRRVTSLKRKREEYVESVQQYYHVADTDRAVKEQTTLRQILVDLPRTSPEIPLFQQVVIQQCMERILYIWAVRHPASGYVQGINDLLTPFMVVFLACYVDEPISCDVSLISSESLQEVEADSYWCLTKLLDGIQDHYTFSQPGIQRMVFKMEELVHRCDADLHHHLVEEEGVQFLHFAFRWMNCLLMRELPLDAIIRLWDTYFSENGGFERFHVYVCTAICMTFGFQLQAMQFQDIIMFLQNLPSQEWTDQEIEPLLSRAFILQSYFEDAPHHLT